ncbi:hypothetical protein ABVT39_002429 [Epinephelus coioides]
MGVSPAELLLGRKIRTTLPTLEKNLRPKWPNRKIVKQKDAGEKVKQAFYYNHRHGARPLPPLRPGDAVFTKLDQEKAWVTPAVVSKECVTPRSHLINTLQGAVLRRNRRYLRADLPSQPTQDTPPASAESAGVTSQSASVIIPETVSSSTHPYTDTRTISHRSWTDVQTGRQTRPVDRH